jgi:iron complex outermembrane receptor protein
MIMLASFARPLDAAGQNTTPLRRSHELIVSATAAPVAPEWTGRTVVIVTGDELGRLGINVLADALRLVPGMDVRARGPWDVQTDFSIRGATFGQQLVLIDGVRLNDSQSGHHNGDIPAAVVGIERLEIVTGPGSALHGADALGGVINVVTRRTAHASGSFSAGEHGLFAGALSAQGSRVPFGLTVSAWGSRSSGFETGREFAQGGASARTPSWHGWQSGVRYVRKEFGARNFYGPSLSKEWTDQSLLSSDYRHAAGSWISSVHVAYRNHGDQFRWDRNRPGFAENRHRTNAVSGDVRVQNEGASGRRVSGGGGAGGDWVTSTNLGDHDYTRAHGFVELQQPLASRALVTAGLRADSYSRFGSSLNPSLAAAVQLTPTWRLRSSVARAFRVPTFTELYYTDPSNLGSPDLVAEHGWSLDAGVQFDRGPWSASVAPFVRWDSNVIDWVRPTAAERWRSTNVRDVTSRGIDLSLAHRRESGFARVYYSGLSVDAPAVTTLSKYVLEYARHAVGGAAALSLPVRFQIGATVDYRRRIDGQEYTLIGLRLARAFRFGELFVSGSNVLNERYREIAGVNMPGRWMTAGFQLSRLR